MDKDTTRINIIRSKWYAIKVQVVQQWDKITYEDVDQINGSCEDLELMLKKKYGFEKKQAQEEIDKFLERNLWLDK